MTAVRPPSLRANMFRAAERRTSDQLPECPACHDLNDTGVRFCATCGTRLLPYALEDGSP